MNCVLQIIPKHNNSMSLIAIHVYSDLELSHDLRIETVDFLGRAKRFN